MNQSNLYYLEPPSRYAILVSGRGNEAERRGFENMVHELGTEFERRGFTCIPMTKYVTGWRVEDLLDLIKIKCSRTRRQPKVIFSYVGHFKPEVGFQLYGNNYSSDKLMERIGRIRGEKLGIFDCCYAGHMKRYSQRDLAILAAAQEDRLAYAYSDERGMRTMLSGEIINFFRGNSNNVMLEKMFGEIENLGDRNGIEQTPEMKGSKIFLFPERRC